MPPRRTVKSIDSYSFFIEMAKQSDNKWLKSDQMMQKRWPIDFSGHQLPSSLWILEKSRKYQNRIKSEAKCQR